ncbi:MAG: sulfite exporter TauE/SafE family protein [Acidobacteriota bacterium]|nr:sulfite exporter TauE/SafE family protein [Acidobacteriota bacterium]
MPHLDVLQWFLAAIAAACVGIGKAGITGMGLLPVVIFAFIFGARTSTGIVLPMLIVGDVTAVRAFHQHARWDYIRRMLPPACIGVMASAWYMRTLSETVYKPIIGVIILGLVVLQVARMQRPGWFGSVPHTRVFAWTIGLVAGGATMLANAAGPIFAIYCLAVSLPKMEFVGTSAWFFLIVNTFKIPFSIALGLIHGGTLLLNVALSPLIVAGLLAGRWLTKRIPQRTFDLLLLGFSALAALRLIGLF